MALSWARKRQITYISIIFITFLVVGVGVYFIYFYQPPSCSDGKQNQDEVGIDCGGVCEQLCVSQVRELNVLWAEALRVENGVYNAVAYIENANVSFEARNLSYEFTFFGPNGNTLETRSGTTFVPRNQRIGIFEGRVMTDGTPIDRTEFRFTDDPEWYRDATPDPEFTVQDSDLSDEDTRPFVRATLINESVKTLENIDAVVVVYDDFNNPIAASKTLIKRLPKNTSAPLAYTWPEPYTVGDRVCEVPVEAALVIDRSGSMDDDQLDPPQPLTDVKNAARQFVDLMGNDDTIGVVSFAITASDPVDSRLTFDHEEIKRVISDIRIGTDGIQHTNTADGVRVATQMLAGDRATSTARHALVVLTDGIATRPLPQAGAGVDPQRYAEERALEEARRAKDAGYQVYVIGLGANLNPDFLEELASTPEHFFLAPTSDRLADVYTEIASSICKLGPKVIEIIPRLPVDQY